MNPLITLSIPVYNVEKYVEKALTSALNQTYDNLEILVIDDKGNDNSMEVVRGVISNHPRGNIVKIIEHEHNQGLGATRNTSIDNAEGKYLFFMDSDDYIANNCIEILYKALTITDAEMAVGSFIHFDVSNMKTIPHNCSNHTFCGKDAYNDFYISPSYYVQTWNKLYDISVLRKNNVRCIPSNNNEDIFFSFQLFPSIKKIVTVSNITYFYAIGDTNAVTFNMRKKLIDNKRVSQYIGILNEMFSVYSLKGNRHMAKYLLEIKARLIRDICQSINTKKIEKKEYLKKIPSFDKLESTEFIKKIHYPLRRYLESDPFKAVRYENITNLPIRIIKKIKIMILGYK